MGKYLHHQPTIIAEILSEIEAHAHNALETN